MRKLSLVVGMLLLAGCSSSSSNGASSGGTGGQDGGSGSGDDGGGGASCTESPLAEVTALPASSTLVDVAADAAGAWLLLKGQDGSLTVARASGGEKHTLEASNVAAAAITTKADGKVCAAWGLGKPYGIHTACAPDFSVVDTKLTTEIDPSAPLAYREGVEGSVLFFEGKYASLAAAVQSDGQWMDEDLQESSISFPGGAHALSGTADGSPYCFVADEGASAAPVLVRGWGGSGSASDFGVVSLDGSAAAKTCAVAKAGSTVGVLVTGGGQAKFAAATQDPAGFAGKLAPEAFDAQGITASDLVGTSAGFVAVYATPTGTFRATRAPGAAGFTATPLASLPTGAHADRVALALGPSGAEHLVVEDMGASGGPKVYYQKSCH